MTKSMRIATKRRRGRMGEGTRKGGGLRGAVITLQGAAIARLSAETRAALKVGMAAAVDELNRRLAAERAAGGER